MKRTSLIRFAIRLGIKEGRLHTRNRVHKALRKHNHRMLFQNIFRQGEEGHNFFL